MAAKTITINEVCRETEKAILAKVTVEELNTHQIRERQSWLPKSRVTVEGNVATFPAWLYCAKLEDIAADSRCNGMTFQIH